MAGNDYSRSIFYHQQSINEGTESLRIKDVNGEGVQFSLLLKQLIADGIRFAEKLN